MTAIDLSFRHYTAAECRAAGVTAVGRYLTQWGGDGTTNGKAITKAELDTLLGGAVEVFLFVETGTNDATGGAAGGARMATAVNAALSNLGLPLSTPVYFAADTAYASPADVVPYWEGIATVRSPAVNGAYGEGALTQLLHQQGLIAFSMQSESRAFPGNAGTLPTTAVQQLPTTPPLPTTDLDVIEKPDFGQVPRPPIPAPPEPRVVKPLSGTYGKLNAPVVAIAATPTGKGYTMVAADGGTFAFGDAGFEGSMAGKTLAAPVVDGVMTPSGKGLLLVGTDGGVFSFGDAPFDGSEGGKALNAPVVGVAVTTTGKGYWLVAADGGVFSFGDARFFGSMGNAQLNAPMVGIAPTPSGKGYWLAGSDGGVFCFGDAAYDGSMGGTQLAKPVVGITAAGTGYLMVATDGGLFAFDGQFHGSMGNQPLNAPMVGVVPTPDSGGYWEVGADGGVFCFGNAEMFGSAA